jgi:hypothetical protein
MSPRSSTRSKPPWWGPRQDVGPPNPIFTARLFALSNRRRDVWATALLVVVIAASRLVAFPASIWEQDEAYFGCAVIDFDVTVHHPHPPWFPLWIALGKVAHVVVEEPTRALQIVSLLASLWVVFPLTALFSLWLRRDLAVAAAILYLFSPATIFLSGRAFSGPTATALFVCALAFWLRGVDDGQGAAAGSLMAGLCLLTRPHFLAPVAAVLAYRVYISRSPGERWLVVVPLCCAGAIGVGAVAVDAGGLSPLWQSIEEHGAYHFGALEEADLPLQDSGLVRYFLRSWVAFVWIALAVLGLWQTHRHRNRQATVIGLLGLLPLLVTVHTVTYAGNVRYWVPIVALGSGFAVLGIALLARHRTMPMTALLCVAIFAAAWPAMREYRAIESPPIRALEATMDEAGHRGAVIVADGTLTAFFEYERLKDPFPNTVLFASQLGTETVPPPAWATVAISDEGHGGFVTSAERFEVYRCDHWWLPRLSQGRFLTITVFSGAETRNPAPPRDHSRGQ